MIFSSICKKLERGARNGERVHLTVEEARALIVSDAYPTLQALARAELIETWAKAGAPIKSQGGQPSETEARRARRRAREILS